jgi:large subunit ribosomal protein L10
VFVALKKERKEELIDQYVDLLRESKGIVLTEYRGLSNKQLTKLRRTIREANGAYHVTKVTLLRRALEETGYQLPDNLDGAPIGVGFALSDMPALAKALREFAKSEELFSVRGGVMGASVMDKAQVEALADLPSLDVLQSRFWACSTALLLTWLGLSKPECRRSSTSSRRTCKSRVRPPKPLVTSSSRHSFREVITTICV